MRHFFYTSLCALGLLAASSCAKHYQLAGVERTQIIIDNRYDQKPVKAAWDFLAPYSHVVDSTLGPVVGHAAHNMAANRPESDLSNLLADILVWAAKDYNEKPVMGIYNMGGIRAALTKGEVTVGSVLDIAPFENKIAFITLSGKRLTELFQQIAKRGGEGVSHGVELVITKDGSLVSAKLHGKDIDPEAQYRLATIDYLTQGNDGMIALSQFSDINAPKDASNNMRFIIMNYFREKEKEGKAVEAKVEGRITVK